jgi:hypothetical protein
LEQAAIILVKDPIIWATKEEKKADASKNLQPMPIFFLLVWIFLSKLLYLQDKQQNIHIKKEESMTDKQIAKQNMLRVVIRTLDEYASLYVGVPVFAATVKDLKTTVQAIEKEAVLQSQATRKGASEEKQEAETELVNRTVTVANVLSVLAADTKNSTLSEKVKVTKSLLYQQHDSVALDIARRIHAEAQANAGALEAYGLSTEALAALETAVARYDTLMAAPRAAVTEAKQKTANIVRLLAETDTLLNDRLDKLMSLFKLSAPDFYAIYFNARNIINTAARKRKPAEGGQEEKA